MVIQLTILTSDIGTSDILNWFKVYFLVVLPIYLLSNIHGTLEHVINININTSWLPLHTEWPDQAMLHIPIIAWEMIWIKVQHPQMMEFTVESFFKNKFVSGLNFSQFPEGCQARVEAAIQIVVSPVPRERTTFDDIVMMMSQSTVQQSTKQISLGQQSGGHHGAHIDLHTSDGLTEKLFFKK